MTAGSPLRADLGSMLDSDLIRAAREQTPGASDELFRRHWEGGVRVATGMVGRSDAEDLVSEAFVKILDLINRGKGPDYAFRPYLMATKRTINVDRIRRGKDILVDDFGQKSFEPTTAD